MQLALAIRPAYNRRPNLAGLMGLGDCTSQLAIYSGVPYCRDNATGSLVPCAQCGPSGGVAAPPPSNMPTYIAPGDPNYSTQQFGNSTTTTFTLSSYMSQWLAGVTASSPAALANQGLTPATLPAEAMAVAQQYCAVEGPPDCNQIGAIVAAVVSALNAAFANVPASQFNTNTYTPYAAPTPVMQPTSPAATQNVLNPPAKVTVSPSAGSNVLNPPAAGSNPTGSPSNVQINTGFNTGNSTSGGQTGNGGNTSTDSSAPFDFSKFISDNGVLIAVVLGAVFVLPQLTKGGR